MPAIAEVLPGFQFPLWTGLFAPAKTPKPIIDRLAAEIGKAMQDPATKKRYTDVKVEAVGSSSGRFDTFFREQLKFNEDVIKRAQHPARIAASCEGTTMGTYIVLVNSTDKGAVNVREVPNRQQTSRDTAAKLGIVRKTVYMTLGPYDFVQIIEAPNDEAVAKYVLSINSKGNVRTTTMRAWDEAEHFEFIKAMP